MKKWKAGAVMFFFACIIATFLFFSWNGDVLAGTLSCSITTSTCALPSIVMLRLASSTNSHSELPTFSDYPVMVCCNGVVGLGNSCAATFHSVIVNIASSTNSHIEENTQSNYSNYACLSVYAGTTTIGYTTSTCAAKGFDTTLFSMASTTNSHAAQPGSYSIQVCGSATSTGTPPPTVSSVVLNNASNIVLTPNATTSISVNAVITDPNGCSAITGGTTTVLLYRSGVSSSSCMSGSGNGESANLNCYKASAFTASSTCLTDVVNTTTTFGVYYFAQATDASSSFPSQNWLGTVIFKNSLNATGTGDSAGQELLTMTGINVTTSSINYGLTNPSSTVGGNISTTVQNAGNCSTTLQLSGTALINGTYLIATSSQHYATSSFTYGGNEQQLQSTPATVSGFTLTAPTSTNPVQGNVFWGLGVPIGTPSGTYNGSTTFTAVFSS